MPKLVKVLSIDGGGIRGIVPATVLAEIERRTKRPVAKLFDLVAGTSTGGILALGLTISKDPDGPLYRADEFADMYAREGPRIFSRSLWHKVSGCNNLMNVKYSSAGIEQVLEEFFGESRLAHAATSVLVTSYEIQRNFPFFFKSSNARRRADHDFPARQVARAASAAPTYFEPMKLPTGTNTDYFTLIDGGVYANNPAACALVEARTTHPDASGFLIVSLGTGSLRHSLRYDAARTWGVAKWAVPLLTVVFDGVSSTVDYQMRQLMPDVPGDPKHYYRFQTHLEPRQHSLDNTCAANIAALKALADKLIERQSGDLNELCDTLLTK
jgi:patatin-like phospholipase/acyl hydrolase